MLGMLKKWVVEMAIFASKDFIMQDTVISAFKMAWE